MKIDWDLKSTTLELRTEYTENSMGKRSIDWDLEKTPLEIKAVFEA